ncbi:MAG: metallophosphoesterase [Phycisphaerae bacterium]
MKILYTSDLHGRASLYEQLAALAFSERPDGLILGGDLLPDGDPNDSQVVQSGFVLGPLRELLERLHDRLPGLRAAVVFGNHELRCAEQAIAQLSSAGLIELLRADRPVRWAALSLLGYPCSPPCPHWAKDFERLDRPGQSTPFTQGAVWNARLGRIEPVDAAQYLASQPSIEEDLARMARVERPWILVAHVPPSSLGLDRLETGESVGSQAMLQFLRRRQPDVSLHGHVHESPRMTGLFWRRIGRTIAINPGQGQERLAAVTFEADRPAKTLVPLGVDLRPGCPTPWS